MGGWASAIQAGIGQMTPAQQALYGGSASNVGSSMPRRRKAKRGKKKAARAAPRRRKSGRAKGKRLRKGSPEAKRRMAKLRRMRRK
jgi:hypothetical protein